MDNELGVAASPPLAGLRPQPAARSSQSGIPNADAHPWAFIAEELLARGWSVETLALRMAIGDYHKFASEVAVNTLTLDLYRHVGPTDPRCRIGETAGKAIARAFDVHEDFILNLERAWRTGAAAVNGATVSEFMLASGCEPEPDSMLASASALEAAAAGETRSGSTEGESAAPNGGDAHV